MGIGNRLQHICGLRKGRLDQGRQAGIGEFQSERLFRVDPGKSVVLIGGVVRRLTSPFVDQPDIHSEIGPLHVSKRFRRWWRD